jgi:hypothetical protein
VAADAARAFSPQSKRSLIAILRGIKLDEAENGILRRHIDHPADGAPIWPLGRRGAVFYQRLRGG